MASRSKRLAPDKRHKIVPYQPPKQLLPVQALIKDAGCRTASALAEMARKGSGIGRQDIALLTEAFRLLNASRALVRAFYSGTDRLGVNDFYIFPPANQQIDPMVVRVGGERVKRKPG